MADSRVIHGSCACRAVKFTITGDKRDAVACHCESCRKQSGHFIAATRVPETALAFQQGEARVKWWFATEDAKRGFCDTCGSLMFWQRAGSDHISVFTGCLDGETGLTLTHHIYASEKGDYYKINDGLPVFDEYS